MPGLFTSQGVTALRSLSERRSALVFDLDGTLAPIDVRPDDARVPASTATRLQAVSLVWPVAVVTGRAVRDAVGRLGFKPLSLFGNHGAEKRGRESTLQSRAFQRALDPVRGQLRSRASELQRLGIDVEDKALSLALHYRRSANPGAARESLGELLRHRSAGLRVEDGHRVVNLTPAQAPDKGDALREVLSEWDLECALVIGDDSNDEPAFTKAPAGSVSVRIGAAERPTAAQFTLDRQAEIDTLLDLLLGLRRVRGAAI